MRGWRHRWSFKLLNPTMVGHCSSINGRQNLPLIHDKIHYFPWLRWSCGSVVKNKQWKEFHMKMKLPKRIKWEIDERGHTAYFLIRPKRCLYKISTHRVGPKHEQYCVRVAKAGSGNDNVVFFWPEVIPDVIRVLSTIVKNGLCPPDENYPPA